MRRVIAISLLLSVLAQASSEAPRPTHHSDDGFRNPYFGHSSDKNVFSYMKMKYFGDEPFADQAAEAYRMDIAGDAVASMHRVGEHPRITWFGHSTFLIQYAGLRILTDPMLSDRASPVFFAGPERLVDKPITLSELPDIDYVIISHNHYDHLDQYSIEWLGDAPVYLVPLGLKAWFEDLGIDGDRVHEFDWWEERRFGELGIAATPSQHWSGRGLFDRYETLWAAWRIDLGEFSAWFAGDTGYNDVQFREIHDRYGDVDLALIPIGAYAPRWFMQASHVNPQEAVQVHNDIGAKLSIGMHWATFQLTAEPFFEPRQGLQAAVENGELQRGRFITLAIGESMDITGY